MSENRNNPRPIGSFRVSISHRSSSDSLREHEGIGDEWEVYSTLRIPFSDESYTVRIETVWVDLLEGQSDRIEKEVDGLCTIFKFGDTMQLREPFRVVIEINR